MPDKTYAEAKKAADKLPENELHVVARRIGRRNANIGRVLTRIADTRSRMRANA